jgi:hypothetical protein
MNVGRSSDAAVERVPADDVPDSNLGKVSRQWLAAVTLDEGTG